jgi:tetratricopeptide (TPR) repeat protein
MATVRISFADEATPAANIAAARNHFEKARTYYGQGAYREAISELEAAHAFDPGAKDLVFNLGVVHEKLADIDEALKWFRLFTTMDLTAQERERVDAYVKRLEGAKKELEEKQAAPPKPPAGATQLQSPVPAAGAPPTEPPPAVEKTASGRLDGLTVTALGVTAAGLAFGVVMAVRAKIDEPPANIVTGGDTGVTYSYLVNRQNNAHREAVLADIGFGVALAGAIASATLFFARPRAMSTTSSATVSAAPLKSGAALFVQGSF